MIALGIDPGTRLLGWGVVRREGVRLHHVAHGVIRPAASAELPARLAHIERSLIEVLATYRPQVGSVETLFFGKDATSAAKLGHARGVVLLALERAQVAIHEHAPARVKRTLAGHGQAEKRQVGLMVQAVLGLAELPPADASDALALAITQLRLPAFRQGSGANPSSRRRKLPDHVQAAVDRARAARAR